MYYIVRAINTGLFCLVFTLFAAAQNRTVSGEFYNVKFPDFVKQAEAGKDFRFYYNEAELDSFTVNVKLVDQPVADALQKIFAHTDFRFSIDAGNNIFITKNRSLQTALAKDFFNPGTTNITDETDTSQNEVIKGKAKPAFTENKLFEIGSRSSAKKNNVIVTGFVRDLKNGEALPAASIILDNLFTGVVTDQFGYYSLTLKPGSHIMEVTSLGMKDTRRHLMVYGDGRLNIDLQEYIARLKNVTVVAERNSTIRSSQLGVDRLTIRTIKVVPVIFGESDILRVVLTLPGVTSVGEASTGFNVRGGAASQNLILFDDATVYNPSHLLGFFSAFNTDVVKGVELYKSVIPVQYGGRLSSVLDVSTKDGNDKKISGTGGIGLLTSKFTLEGPIKKDKTSFILGARTT